MKGVLWVEKLLRGVIYIEGARRLCRISLALYRTQPQRHLAAAGGVAAVVIVVVVVVVVVVVS